MSLSSLPKRLVRLLGAPRKGDAHAARRNGKDVACGEGRAAPPVFAVGTGRSGTHFLHRLMDEDPCVVSHHLDTFGEFDADSFAFYCVWNKLPVDLGAFLYGRRSQIEAAASRGAVYFESNPYLALVIRPLYESFGAKFLHVVRNPESVVKSHFVKGWYRETPFKTDPALALGFQPGMRTNHFFGRIVPHGEEFLRWQKLTQVGRIAWMWNAVNVEAVAQLRQLPESQHTFVRLDELDYEHYLRLQRFVGGSAPMSEARFVRIKEERPGKGPKKRGGDEWSAQERREFLSETSEARRLLGYE